MNRRNLLPLIFVTMGAVSATQAQSPYQSSTDFAKYAMKLRENALLKVEPQVIVPTTARFTASKYPWKRNIVTTTFWVGEDAGVNNPVHNHKSSWDALWVFSYGGFDNPDPRARKNFIPVKFVPRQNPFYIALPYNDVERGMTKPEAPRSIPWFAEKFEKPGKTVLKGRWLAINRGNRTCYAQWEDCGPFRTDHWQYVFGPELPKWNLNRGAGLDVSPAVRDYLGMGGTDVCNWRFVDDREVPNGPWALYGDNNTFVINRRKAAQQVAQKGDAPTVRLNN